MLIRDIAPYGRNARVHRDADLAALTESIREFGLRGRIQLESPERPVIVNGHGRVEACRRLGWEEIPDENIEFVGDLTDEQIRAYRIADNRTAEGSGCNLDLVSRADCGRDGMPRLRPCMAKPSDMIGFNYAKSMPADAKTGRACHFFIDDYQFERVWSRPAAYLDCLRGFECVLTPDFSLYLDMPDAMQRWNRYRAQALGLYWQREGLRVVPTLSWAQPESCAFCFAGVPRRSTVAVSTVGVKGDETARAVWRVGMRKAMETLRPRRVLLYGGRVGFDFGDAEVVEYGNAVTERMDHGR